MSTESTPRELLDELETLQKVLDDAAGEQIDFERVLTKLNTVDEVPVLSDLFNSEEPPILRPVKKTGRPHLSAVKTTEPAPQKQTISRDVLEFLRQEMLRKGMDDNSLETLMDITGHQPEENKPHLGNQTVQDIVDQNNDDDDVPTLTEEETFNELDAMLDEEIPMADDVIGAIDGLDNIYDEFSTEQWQQTGTDDAFGLNALSEHINRVSAAGTATTTMASNPEVASTPAPASEPKAATPEPAAVRNSGNPFLPQAVLDKLTSERLAAQHSAEEAHRTMQRVMEKKIQKDAESIAQLNSNDHEQIVDELITELTPLIQARLREKLRSILSQKAKKTPE